MKINIQKLAETLERKIQFHKRGKGDFAGVPKDIRKSWSDLGGGDAKTNTHKDNGMHSGSKILDELANLNVGKRRK